MAILASGMVSSVGLSAEASCGAIRCAITGFSETRYMYEGEWILGAEVPLEGSRVGLGKLIEMAAMAIRECLDHYKDLDPSSIPLLLCVAESDRPGRVERLDESLFQGLQNSLGYELSPDSAVIRAGRVGGARALDLARNYLAGNTGPCLVAGVDSLLTPTTVDASYRSNRLLTPENSDGFIPGEAAAAVLVGPRSAEREFCCLGIGHGNEPATIDSGQPLRGNGLADSMTSAIADSGSGFEPVSYRLSDANGTQYAFKEATLALAKVLRPVKEEFDVWHPADCIGEVGAAVVPVALTVASRAFLNGYAPGTSVLCHFSSDGPRRAALVLGP